MSKRTEVRKKNTAQELINLASIDDCRLTTKNGEILCFLIIEPVNLSVLPPDVIQGYIFSLRNAINEIGDVEIMCMNSSQNYESNKKHLEEIALQERNEMLRQLDTMDCQFLDEIRARTATDRQFLFVLRFSRRAEETQISRAIVRVRNILRERGFRTQPAERKDIQRLLAIYFEQNVFAEVLQDFDGQIYADSLLEGNL